MNHFQVGEWVVALEVFNPCPPSIPLIKGQSYIVKAICYCKKCGGQSINVVNTLPKHPKKTKCSLCEHSRDNEGVAWHGSFRFARFSDLEAELKSAVENEDYERAAVIRDIKI